MPAIHLPKGYRDTPAERAAWCFKVQQQTGQTLQIQEIRDGVALMVESPSWAPGAQSVSLAASTRDTDAQHLAAQARAVGMTMISFSLAERTAVRAFLPPANVQVRDRIASALDKKPWEIRCRTRWEDGHLSSVVITHIPSLSLAAETRLQRFRDLVGNLPDGGSGWAVSEDAFKGEVTLAWGKPRSLSRFAMRSDIIKPVGEARWDQIALGLSPTDDIIYDAKRTSPHTLVVGATGSGKTQYLMMIATGFLAAGGQLVICDPSKGNADFLPIQEFCTGWGDEMDSAAEQIMGVYAEVERRKALMKEHRTGFFENLPEDVRPAPLLLIVDEWTSLLLPTIVPKTLPKDHPLVKNAEALNESKSYIQMYAGKIAREARSSGVMIAVGTQRGDTNLIGGGEFRSNLTTAVQMVMAGNTPAPETLGMVFSSDQKAAAAQTIMELDDGRSPGLAVVGVANGRVEGFRVGFTPEEQVRQLALDLGIKPVTPWVPQVPSIMQEDTEAPAPKSGKRPDKGGAFS